MNALNGILRYNLSLYNPNALPLYNNALPTELRRQLVGEVVDISYDLKS